MADRPDTNPDFPRMLYRGPGNDVKHLGTGLAYLIVKDEAELDAAQADGWFTDPGEAKEAYEEAEQIKREEAARAAQADLSGKPTRAELEQKAAELGVPFKPTTSDKKLGELIAAKLATAATA